MKRGEGPKRRKRLGADPEKVREFMQRGRGALGRGRPAGDRRSAPKKKKPQRPPEGPLTPREWQLAVFKASAGRCTVTNTRARDPDDPRFHAHHPVPKQTLRRRGLHDRVWDPRNGMLVLATLHADHEFAPDYRIPGERVPDSAREFAAELGPWAVDLLDRLHPNTRRP